MKLLILLTFAGSGFAATWVGGWDGFLLWLLGACSAWVAREAWDA